MTRVRRRSLPAASARAGWREERGRERPPGLAAPAVPRPARRVAHAPPARVLAVMSQRSAVASAKRLQSRPRSHRRFVAPGASNRSAFTSRFPLRKEAPCHSSKPARAASSSCGTSRASIARRTRRSTRTRTSWASRRSTCSISSSTRCSPRTRSSSRGAPSIPSRTCPASVAPRRGLRGAAQRQNRTGVSARSGGAADSGALA